MMRTIFELNRCLLLAGAVAIALGLSSFPLAGEGDSLPAVKAAPRPNILYIFTDDQSYRTISAYSGAYRFAETPNIDKLAEHGILFSQAYVGAK